MAIRAKLIASQGYIEEEDHCQKAGIEVEDRFQSTKNSRYTLG
jgi:hypothetical protein